ncbi:MAG: pro-sigmaK processing inhibitor BofA family protein [Oscillospiraceae bacterium]|nr:pro-sigmaK processing inhibitor BofA family protein [Oscillospiraceae bacterium]MDE7170955.1 pro-sigmaK processing inhibitor BofA family protein [Oscillospiraceae bacterium]
MWWAAGGLVLALALCRRPLGALCRLVVRSGIGLVFLWLFQGLGTLLGVTLGVNLLNGLVLGALGLPGLGLLLLTQWAWK